MRKNYKLSNFFMLVALLVLGVIGWIAYAHRTNAASNLSEDSKEDVNTSLFNIKGDNRDISSPFYATKASEERREEENKKNEEAAPGGQTGTGTEGKTNEPSLSKEPGVGPEINNSGRGASPAEMNEKEKDKEQK